MIDLLDGSLEDLIRSSVPLPAREVDLSFEAPDREWSTALTRPTVNLFLWDLRRSESQTQSGMSVTEGPDGQTVRRRPPIRMDYRYLVSAWTSDIRDEHALLGSILEVLLPITELPESTLRGRYGAVRPLPTLRVASPSDGERPEFWNALGGRLKPGVDLVVTATVDAAAARDAGPPVERHTTVLKQKGEGDSKPHAGERTRIGGTSAAAEARLWSPRDSVVADRSGSFIVAAEVGDTVMEETEDGQRRTQVPENGVIRFRGRRRPM